MLLVFGCSAPVFAVFAHGYRIGIEVDLIIGLELNITWLFWGGSNLTWLLCWDRNWIGLGAGGRS